MSLSPGQRLGPYEITGILGAGGMGEVYRARDARLGRDVAVKLLPPQLAADPAALARFEREARAVAALTHPNILAIHDFGRTDEATFAVMELLEGETLRVRIAAGPLPPRKAVEIATQIARGLAAAHDRQIVHRDLKPENVFVTTDGSVKVLDFGLARSAAMFAGIQADTPTMAPSTEPGVLLGTVGYMAPEQVRGEPADHRADIFALGCVLYELLTAKRPFRRDTAAETMTAILRDDPPDPPNPVPPALLRTMRRCLEKRPDERFQSARDLAFALESSLDPSNATSPSAGLGLRPASRLRSAAAFVVLGALIGAAAVLLTTRRTGSEARLQTAPEFRRLTFDRGTIREARFTRDGTVVYSAAWGGQPLRLFLTRTDSPDSVKLNLPDAHLLSVSRSGEMAISLGHTFEGWMGSGTLARSSLLGSAPRPVAENVREAEWSPDGADLAIVRRVGAFERLEFPTGHVLYQTAGYISNIRFSPAGDRIAFADHPQYADDAGNVVMVDLKGQKTVLAEKFLTVSGVAWGPDGRDIWFSGTAGGGFAIYAVTVHGQQRIVHASSSSLRLFDVSADGRVLLGDQEIERGVEAVLAGDTEPRDVSIRDLSTTQWIAADGGLMTISDQSVPRYASYLLRAGTGAPVHLGEGQAYGVSPDGRWIVALPVGEPRILLHPTGAGQTRELPNPENLVFDSIDWLPDGRLVAFGKPVGELPQGYLQDTQNGPPRPFTSKGVTAVRWWTVSVSPDGKKVLAQMPDGQTVLYPLSGGEPVPLKGLRDGEVPIRWTADEGVLLVGHRTGPRWRIERFEIATGRRSPALEIKARDEAGLRLSVVALSRDARYYAHAYGRLLTALYVVNGLH